MYTLDITERDFEIIYRSVEYHIDRILKYVNDDNHYDITVNFPTYGKIDVELCISRSEEEENVIDKTLYFNDKKTEHILFHLDLVELEEEVPCTENKILELLKNAIKDYKPQRFCDCHIPIMNPKYEVCCRCYSYETNNPEACPICLENGVGVWVKSKKCNCNYYYHQKCLVVSKCPTCRHPINKYDVERL